MIGLKKIILSTFCYVTLHLVCPIHISAMLLPFVPHTEEQIKEALIAANPRQFFQRLIDATNYDLAHPTKAEELAKTKAVIQEPTMYGREDFFKQLLIEDMFNKYLNFRNQEHYEDWAATFFSGIDHLLDLLELQQKTHLEILTADQLAWTMQTCVKYIDLYKNSRLFSVAAMVQLQAAQTLQKQN